jgi:hypothetical protein
MVAVVIQHWLTKARNVQVTRLPPTVYPGKGKNQKKLLLAKITSRYLFDQAD